jgi:hypothetical protein
MGRWTAPSDYDYLDETANLEPEVPEDEEPIVPAVVVEPESDEPTECPF